MLSKFKLLVSIIMFTSITFSQGVITIKDADISPGQPYNMTANNTYILDGFVFVEDGSVLNIQAGTIIKGKAVPTTGDNASALIISQGGKIHAAGTPNKPIIFTAEADNVSDPFDLTYEDRGLWGGVILLGKASVNTTSGTGQIEGIPSTEPRGLYGGGATPDDNDNSGVMRYVSIRHGGAEIGAGNEINGLTMGGVGRGTITEYIEVFANVDDSFEWFGGTVNSRYLVSSFPGDDSFDFDEGWTANNQFWFAIHDADNGGGRIGEHDGGTVPEDGLPFALPTIYNATYIGPGITALPQGDGAEALIFRDNAGGKYVNSIITEYNGANGGNGIRVEDLASGEDSRARLEAGDLVLSNNIWWQFGAGNDLASIAPQDFVQAHLGANNNQIVDPQITGISRTNNGNLNPKPNSSGPAGNGAASPSDPYFSATGYYGAFDPNAPLWINGWTALSQNGHTSNIITLKDADISPGQPYNMTANNTYILDGFVFVEDGSVLNIEAGTVIKGKAVPTTGDNASALIVSQGGQIFAEGTPVNPIIFTAEADNVSDPFDLTYEDRGLWGGVILLGKASVNTTSGTGQIEGIPSTEPRGLYGGGATPDDNDNSGVMRYVSIRHGGAEIGAGNEINGLTMGGVGRGTITEYIEVFANVDDSFEWFGGTVNSRYLVSSFPGDDSFDFDEGWTANNQFWFAIHDADNGGGRIGEHDGGTVPEDGLPFALPTIYNATYIGPGITALPQGDGAEALIFRDNAGGKYVNSIITEYNGANGGNGIRVEDLASGEDSRARLEAGDLVLSNNIWWQFGAGNDLASIAPQDFVQAHLAANNNLIVDPQITGISRTNDGNLDPRPNPAGPAASGAIAPTELYFAPTSYYGAFDPNADILWTSGWTALSQNLITNIKETELNESMPNDFLLSQNYPNPFNPVTNIKYSLPEASSVKIRIYNVLGEQVAELFNGFRNAGSYEINWDASNLSSGVYIYQLEAGNKIISKKMTLLK
jgi:trimeric autotransporter adhesin